MYVIGGVFIGSVLRYAAHVVSELSFSEAMLRRVRFGLDLFVRL